MAISVEQLSEVTRLYYDGLPDKFKAKAIQFFRSLDTDEDGRLTLAELLKSVVAKKFGREFVQYIFQALDADGNKYLDFEECITLYYLCIHSNRSCNSCGKTVLQGLGYNCSTCYKSGGARFHLCLDCYSSGRFNHEHTNQILHDYVFFDSMLDNSSQLESSKQGQCIVCGDFHLIGARGFLGEKHSVKMKSSDEYVCEWCFTYLCAKCGNMFKDNTARAEPGKWLQKYVCPSCHRLQIQNDCYDSSVKRLHEYLSRAELLKSCKTCGIKHRNGTLMWVPGATASVVAAAAAAGPPSVHRASSSNSYFAGAPAGVVAGANSYPAGPPPALGFPTAPNSYRPHLAFATATNSYPAGPPPGVARANSYPTSPPLGRSSAGLLNPNANMIRTFAAAARTMANLVNPATGYQGGTFNDQGGAYDDQGGAGYSDQAGDDSNAVFDSSGVSDSLDSLDLQDSSCEVM